MFRSNARCVSIAFETDNVAVYVDWVSLPDGGRNYSLRTPIRKAPNVYSFYLFGIITLDINGWSIMDTTTGRFLKIPSWGFINGIGIRKLTSRVLQKEYTVSVATIHSHHIEYAPNGSTYRVQPRTSPMTANETTVPESMEMLQTVV